MKETPSIEDGLAKHRAGDLAGAAAVYRAILEAKPEETEALYFLGLIEHQAGHHEAAIPLLQRALKANPGDIGMLSNLGLVLAAAGRPEEASEAFRAALQNDPGNPGLLNSLGVALKQAGRPAEAEAALTQAVASDPTFAGARFNLGNLRLEQGQMAEAVEAYEGALRAAPHDPEPLSNLGVALKALGRLDEAAGALRRAVEYRPDDAGAWNNLGNVYRERREPGRAVAALEEAVGLDPTNADVRYNLGAALSDAGGLNRAVTEWGNAAGLRPSFTKARWAEQLALPILYDSEDEIAEWRARWTEGLAVMEEEVRLHTPDQIAEARSAVRELTNFALPYQGELDVDLQRRYGSLIQRIAAAAHPEWAEPRPRRAGMEKIRVAFASPHFHAHTVLKLFGGWMRGLDRMRFEVFGIHTGQTTDGATRAILRSLDGLVEPEPDDRRLMAAIADLAPDVLIYLDIGMDPRVQLLSGLRLAPVQCVTWGHPETTGLPTMDAFLSSDMMEPVGAEAHYTERLVRLPNLSISYAEPVVSPARSRTDGNPVFLCTQSLFKLLPRFDDMLARIAEDTGPCVMRFLAHQSEMVTQRFRERLGRAFAARGLDAEDYVEILPPVDQKGFFTLNQQADVLLDSPAWSGGNTTLEAIACGLPVVTLPGTLMRGRHTTAILQRLDCPETIAADEDAYVDSAVRLATETPYHTTVLGKVRGNRFSIFDDAEPVEALAGFLEESFLA